VIVFLNSINQLIFVMVKCGVLFEVRTEFLNVISWASKDLVPRNEEFTISVKIIKHVI
jgi:hypothetical protein